MKGKTVDLIQVLTGDGMSLDFAAVSLALSGGPRHVVACPGDGDRTLMERAVYAFASQRDDLDRACCDALDAIWDSWHSASRETRMALTAAVKAVSAASKRTDAIIIETWDAVPEDAGNAP